MTGPDTRSEAAIAAGVHAVAMLPGYTRFVRGVDRFTHLPTREPAAVVWVADKHALGTFHTEVVALEDICLFPGRSS